MMKQITSNRLKTNITKLTISLYFQSLSSCLVQKVCFVGMEASWEGTSENSPSLCSFQNQEHFPIGIIYRLPVPASCNLMLES